MEKLIVNWENMNEYMDVPIEYRFIDYAEVSPGRESWGFKAVSSQDWFFKFHFPGNPVMPGVMVMETLHQTGLLIVTSLHETDEKEMLISDCKNMRMYNSVRPGDLLKTHVELENYKRGIASFHGEVRIKRNNDEKELLACSMKFTMGLKSRIFSMPVDSTSEFPEMKGATAYDYSNLGVYLADPPEYRFIDRVSVFGNKGVGIKYTSSLDWYFRFNEITMPVGCVMEAIMQTGVILVTQDDRIVNPLMMFNDCKCLTVSGTVNPGEVLNTYVELMSFRNGVANYEGRAIVEDKEICSMSFTLIHPDEIAKFSESLKQRRNV